MSLFKLRNLWSDSYAEQQFDQRHLCVGQVDGRTAVGLGSFKGMLRVYVMVVKNSVNLSLIYENDIGQGIVSVQFVTHPNERERNTIGVLLFRKFCYISFKKNPETNNYEAKTLQIETQPAFDICPNPISLMTLNSSIEYLMPHSIETIKVSDPIFPFVCNENHMYYVDGEELVLVKGSIEQWRIIVGPMRHLHLLEDMVIVIGDYAVWEVSDATIHKTKVFDDAISYGTIIEKESNYNLIVATFQSHLFIYTSEYQLLWAVKLEYVALKIVVFQEKLLKGALGILSDYGTFDVCYLGSELPEVKIEPLNEKIDMKQVDKEIELYQQEIIKRKQSSAQSQQTQVQKDLSTDHLQVNVKVSKIDYVDDMIKQGERLYSIDECIVRCTVKCEIKAEKQTLTNAKLTLSLPSNIISPKSEVSISSIKGREAVTFDLFCSSEKYPHNYQGTILIRYNIGQKSAFVTKSFQFPIELQCAFRSWQGLDKPENKIVLKGNGELPNFLELFPEFEQSEEKKKSVTLKLSNEIQCSMGYNKGNTKIKFESQFFSGLCFLAILYIHRIDQHNKRKNKRIQLDIDIPLEEFFSIMKEHHQFRATVKAKYEELQNKSDEFLSMEKLLLMKMKEKMSSANNLDKVLEYTYKRLMQAADNYESVCEQMEVINHNLEISIKFVIQLLMAKAKGTEKCRKIVQGIIGYEKQNNSYGWQQKVMSNSAYFLNKRYNYSTDSYKFDQLYKVVIWVISKANEGEWNQ